jgi:hypothetical protein
VVRLRLFEGNGQGIFIFQKFRTLTSVRQIFFAAAMSPFEPAVYDIIRTVCVGIRKFGSNDQNLLQNIPSDVD